MAKPTVLSKAIAVGVLVLLTVGLGVFLLPRLMAVVAGEEVSWTPELSVTEAPLSPFEEQALLQQSYADVLTQDIVTALERLTGAGTVQATVRVELDLIRGSATKHRHHTRYTESRLAGDVQRLSVNVLIDGQMVSSKNGRQIYQPRSRADMAHYTDLVKTIIGFDPGRGDKVEVLNMPFTGPKSAFWGISVRTWGQMVTIILLSALIVSLIFWVILPFLRAVVKSVPEPASHSRNSLYRQVERLCRQSPERAAQTLRGLLRQKQVKSARDYAPAAQAVMVVMTLDRDIVRRVLGYLTTPEVKLLGRIGSRLGTVPSRDIQAALETFIQNFDMPSVLQGTAPEVSSFLAETRPDGKQLFSEIKLTENGQTLWERIARLDIGTLVGFLKKQSPETSALVLCHLPENLAGQLLALLPTETGSRILIHLTHLKRVKPELLEKMTGEIAQIICDLVHKPHDFGGPEKVAAIIKTMSAKQKSNLMAHVKTTEEAVATEMQPYLWDWSDLIALSDERIQKLLVYCEKEVVATALADRPTEEQIVFARNMTPSLWQEIQASQTEHSSDNEHARAIMLRTARELELFG